MKKLPPSMWSDPNESAAVRGLLQAGRESADVGDYDFEAGLAKHMHLVQIGTPPPAWAAEVARQSSAGLGSAGMPWWGWLAASVLGVTSGAVVWSDGGIGRRDSGAGGSEVRVVETATVSADQRPEVGSEAQPVVTLPTQELRAQPSEAVRETPKAQRRVRRAAANRAGEASLSAAPQVPSAPKALAKSGSTGAGKRPSTVDTKVGTTRSANVEKSRQSASATDSQVEQPVAVAAPLVAQPVPARAPSAAELKRLAEERETAAREALLEREMRMLKVAQANLDADPARSLRLAQQGEREFKNSLFTQERQYVLIAALARLGRHGEARELASTYLKRYPKGPFSDRVRKALSAQQ